MRRLVAAAGTLAVLVLASLLAACGSSGGDTHDTPDGAVHGLVDALSKNDLDAAKEWIVPSERNQFAVSLDEAKTAGLKIQFKVDQFSITGTQVDSKDSNKAVVHTNGKAAACVAGNIGGQALSTCSPVQSGTTKGSDDFVCIRQDGKWYVSINQSASGMRPQPGSAAAA